MDYSATGMWLPAASPLHEPEVWTEMTHVKLESGKKLPCRSWSSTCHGFYRWGRVPVASTVTGLVEGLLGLVHTIVHLSLAIFTKNRAHHLGEASIGAKHVVLGLTAMVPIVGNLALAVYGASIARTAEEKAKEFLYRGNLTTDCCFCDGVFGGH